MPGTVEAPNTTRPRRMLHLIEPSQPGLGGDALRCLGDVVLCLPRHQHRVLLIGTSRDADLARQCNVPIMGLIKPPRWPAIAGWREVARVVRACSRNARPIDLVHAWGMRAAAVSALASPNVNRLVTLLYAPAEGDRSRLVRSVLHRRPAVILCANDAVASRLKALKLEACDIRIAPPGVEPSAGMFVARSQIRERWTREHGIGSDSFVIGLPANPPQAADVHVVVNAAARVYLSGRNVYLVAHSKAARRLYAGEFLRRLKLPARLCIDDDLALPWRVVKGFDAAFLTSSPQSPLPALWAVAAGVPLIAERGAVLAFLDHHTARIIPPASINATADQITWIHDRRAEAAAMAERAKVHFQAAGSMAGHIAVLQHVIERPDLSTG